MHVIHEWNDQKALIRVEGLKDSVHALHISDTHMGLIDERDAPKLDRCRGMGERFHTRHENRDSQGGIIPQEEAYRQMLARAAEEKVDLLALTGDIVDFPSRANVEYAHDQIVDIDVPTLYTAGNHDWQFKGHEPTSEVRTKYWPLLEPLHQGEPAFSRRLINGLQFLAVDNSIYQIEEEQLESTRLALDEGTPTVILLHIPLSLPTLRDAVIDVWGEPILMGDPERPEAEEDTACTRAFIQLVAGAENLVAILCGHIHHSHVDALNPWAAQYLSPPGYAGECRLFEWQPM